MLARLLVQEGGNKQLNSQNFVLRSADLSGADLRDVVLDKGKLTNINLSRANLNNACLEIANLTGALTPDINYGR
ncbi:MAG: pentapeptide repeat-containing protein [Nostoc sp.]|uniref:pentapeptide repeat-containing protein n=1 Tax=Nostoc sp. TaxID=1180 RepID=UPI002FFA9EC5